MSDAAKDAVVAAHAEDPLPGEPDNKGQSIVLNNQALHRFQEQQHSLSVKDSIRESWKPIVWCKSDPVPSPAPHLLYQHADRSRDGAGAYMFVVCIMYGYDALAGSVVIAIEAFRRDFGFRYGNDYVVGADWQLGFQAGFFAGLILGGLAVGPVVGRWGRKKTIALAYIINIAGVFLQFFATTPAQFLGSKLLTGFPLGAFATIAPTYASEMSPLAIRGAITGGMNLAIVLGNTIGYGVIREAAKYEGKASYRILFAVQWGFVGLCLAVLPLLPE